MGTGKGLVSHEFINPWPPKEAEARIRKIAASNFTHMWTDHVKSQISLFNLLMGDILYVCKNGVVNDEGQRSTQPRVFKYTISSAAPNSESKQVYVVVAVDERQNCMKVVDVKMDAASADTQVLGDTGGEK